ncbi:PadR family transcriptional regulator [Microbacteriaceae bacterium VKM Ac-2855]|nr:PadR family transcriptional regulator [Microbacteriaceae bacterium VKM Ac-2855]
MSSIRLFILDSFERHGEMHGHQLRQLAEMEHVHLWTDVSVGSLYGAIKRMVGEDLLAIVRTEREGNFPERQVYAITDTGRARLDRLRSLELSTITFRPDPFDLAISRLDPDKLDELPEVLAERMRGLESLLAQSLESNERAHPYLSIVESLAMAHREQRLRAEIAWLTDVITALPEIAADEKLRTSDAPLKGLPA